jgi:hypothetical protein
MTSRSRTATPAPRTPVAPATRAASTVGAVPWWWSAAIALAVFAVYLLQTPKVSGDKDSAEFTLVLALDGVAHPTGYPLFVLFGHPWTVMVHALGATWAYAANSWTALGGAVAMYLMHRLALALIPAAAALGRWTRAALALLPVMLFAFDPLWTYETSLAEVYAWHVAWVLGAALYFVRSVARVAGRDAPATGTLFRDAALWGAMCGIAGAHHVTGIFVAAPLSITLVIALSIRRRMRLALVPVVLLGALVPMLSYGIIYWRAAHPVSMQWPMLTPGWSGLLFHVTGGQYAHHIGSFRPSSEQVRFLNWYLWPLLVPGLALLVVHAWRARTLVDRTVGWALAAAALAGTAYAFDYDVPDPSSYFLYPLALGCVAVVPLLAALITGRRAARAFGIGAASVIALLAVVLWGRWLETGRERVRLFESFDDFVGRMWASIPFEHGIVFWSNDMYYKLIERQMLGGQKPGLEVTHGLLLLVQPARGRFVARHGFDPGEGMDVISLIARSHGADADTIPRVIERVEQCVNRNSPLPVIHFDPASSTVRLLRKPDAPAPDTASAGGR